MRQVSNAMGVQGWDLSAPDNPTHHSGVERRNRVMEHFLDVGISKGDITCAAALERYCAAATAACNLEYQFNGHTVFELQRKQILRHIPSTRHTYRLDCRQPSPHKLPAYHRYGDEQWLQLGILHVP